MHSAWIWPHQFICQSWNQSENQCLSFILSTLHLIYWGGTGWQRGRAECTASDALDKMLNPCLYRFSHFLRLPVLLNTPFSPPQLQRLNRQCDVYMIIFLPPQGITLGSTSLVCPEEPSLCLCNFNQTARSGVRGQRAAAVSQHPSKSVLQRNPPENIIRQTAVVRGHHQSKKGPTTLLHKEKKKKLKGH